MVAHNSGICYNSHIQSKKEFTMQSVNTVLNTAGTGYWSNAARAVGIVGVDIGYVSDSKEFGELCVYFNTTDWNVDVDGLIYTDSQFMTELKNFLTAQGLDGTDVSYSEQGMQGDAYVSCDVGAKFIATWEAKFGELVV